jgi:hypothetical protein
MEAAISSAIRHPNIIQVLGGGARRAGLGSRPRGGRRSVCHVHSLGMSRQPHALMQSNPHPTIAPPPPRPQTLTYVIKPMASTHAGSIDTRE